MLEYLCYMNNTANSNSIVVMAKYWQSGPVKTRLAASIGDPAARQIYKEMAEQFWLQLQSSQWQRHLWSADKGTATSLGEWLSNHSSLNVQPNFDLGQRMLHALQHTPFANWIGVAGTDAPDLSATYINDLVTSLTSHDICIAPTFDGGYAFIAMKKIHPQLFGDIEWSSPNVLRQTLEAARKNNLSVCLGKKIRDLDTVNDLKQFAARKFSWAQFI